MTATVKIETICSDLDQFTARAAALGVTVSRVAGSAEAAQSINAQLAEAGAARVLISTEITAVAPGLVTTLEAMGCAWDHPGRPASTNDQPFGVSLARLAVAETASVLLAEERLEDRGIGLLVAVQLVICPAGLLRPTLDDAAPMLRELATRPGGAYTTLVTGPSRTADIERALTVGVQGPAKLTVLFVDDLT
jgi:L-lactate dehydrogenase complex protein LldG